MLKSVIEEAKKRDVPKSSIENVLSKLSKTKDTTNAFRRYLFEIRLYKKLYIILSIFTDNLALTRNQLSQPFRKHFAEMTNTKRLFTERGVFHVIGRPDIKADNFEDECLNDAVECGAEDIEIFNIAERQVTFFCDPQEFPKVKQKLSAIGHEIQHAECEFIPNCQTIQLNESESADYVKFKDRLTAVDGLDEIYDNLEDSETT